MSAVEFIAMLRDCANKKEHRIRRYELNAAINVFTDFLPPKPVNPDESLMLDFENYLPERYHDKKATYYRKFTYYVRSAINSLPNIQRQLLNPREFAGMTRWDKYTPETKELFQEFLRDGRRVDTTNDTCKLTTTRLQESTRKGCLANARTFLTALGKNDFLTITVDDIEDLLAIYDERYESRDTVNHLLADLDPLFRYMCAKGMIAKNLVEDIEKPNNINDDYIDQQGIDKLCDFTNLQWDSLVDLRDRMITVGLYYDFSLRRNEAPSLDVSDISFNNHLNITLRPEVQEKAQNRNEAVRTLVFNNFFKSSRILMEAYLELRRKLKLDSPALLVTENNERLGSSGCEDAVVRQCKKCGVTTVYGKVPRCHRLRHSMPTLNIVPLGAKIQWGQIKKRMRHKSIITTERVYITNNPLIDKAEHDAWAMERYGKEEDENVITGSTQSTGSTHSIRPEVASDDIYIPEEDACKMLASFNIKVFALRKYAEEEQALRNNGNRNTYSRKLIENLATNYYTKDEAMRLTCYKKSGFFYWMKSNGIEQVVIGKISLIPSKDVLAKVRGEGT